MYNSAVTSLLVWPLSRREQLDCCSSHILPAMLQPHQCSQTGLIPMWESDLESSSLTFLVLGVFSNWPQFLRQSYLPSFQLFKHFLRCWYLILPFTLTPKQRCQPWKISSNHPVILEIFSWLVLAKRRGHDITFPWVPAHVSVPGNEKADAVARAVASRPPRPCPLPCRNLYPTVRSALHNAWQRRWEDMPTPIKMKEITARAVRPWSYSHVKNRKIQTTLVRLRIGHTRYTHGFLMSQGVQPYCDDSLVPLTVRHLLVECPSLGDVREWFLPLCRNRDDSFPLSLVLGEKVLSALSDVIGYLKDVGVLHHQ